MIKEGELTIYCVYHDPNLIWEYNLDYIPSYVKLFNANNLELEGDNINYLNPYLSEIVALYYVWKNNLYSKYVGFCHYRRFYNYIDYNKLEEIGAYYYAGQRNVVIKNFMGDFWEVDKLYEYLFNLHKFDDNELHKYFYESNPLNCAWKISFILNWDKFVLLCELYFGFLQYLFNDYKNIECYKNTGRDYSRRSEVWIGILAGLINNNYSYEWYSGSHVNMNPIILTKSDSINDITLWLKKNNRVGNLKFILTNKLVADDLLNHNISDSDIISVIKDKSEIKPDYIEIGINEYIKCLDSENFNKGNYTIEKIF